ncbi:LOW QUALITY PROTEIN: adipocyte plasma membrane-associated protein-like [Zootermopsis nevadensis]|uniref:LOW QUALITY PROTEIN: adipocyte plasma membrane-associated protein-like n=1 Tax=Zootermopsis nevadensis TaxID=136037 RepID=UPI000B8EA783|nr:LOW QUALITY PROTEIN: adipocyte plasma membrane-associated protein-like [Zootermopsis nevadensis]
MGFISFIWKSLLKITFIFFLVTLMPGLPPYVQFTEFRVSEPPPLEGLLSVNSLLNNAEQLYSGKVHGPEAFADHKGVLYTGLHGGEIVKFVDGKVVPVAKFGKPCDGFWEETKCGRPLGMKFGPDGLLYVTDAYYGLFKVNVNTGTKTQLVSADELIDGKINKIPNSVDVADDGTVYWTSSSCNFHLNDGLFDLLADGSGRLIRYNPKTKSNEVLIDGLHFPNGVVVSPKEDFVLVAETTKSRIHRYYVEGPKKGSHDIFIDGLPGLPDNLKSDGQGGFLVPLIAVRDKNYPILFQSLGPFPLIRKFIARILALLEMPFEQINNIYPNYYAKRIVHWIGHFISARGLSAQDTVILQLDVDGKIKHSYHNTDGSLSGISEAHWFDGAFYLGSPYNTYVGRVKLSFAEPPKSKQEQKPEPQKEQQSKPQQERQPPLPQQQQKTPSPPQQQQKPPPPQQQQKLSQHQKPSSPQQQQQKPSSPQQQQQQQKPSSPQQQQTIITTATTKTTITTATTKTTITTATTKTPSQQQQEPPSQPPPPPPQRLHQNKP